jgi:hypothetical protein
LPLNDPELRVLGPPFVAAGAVPLGAEFVVLADEVRFVACYSHGALQIFGWLVTVEYRERISMM